MIKILQRLASGSWMRGGLFLAAAIISASLEAQQDPIYSQYLLNPLVLNPAYAGINNNVQAAASYRMQWLGLEGLPTTLNLNGSTSLVDNKVGVGFTLLQDRIGSSKITEFNASFAYKLELNNDRVFSFGMQGGVLGFRNDYSDLNIYDANDDAFTGGTMRTARVNVGAGAMLKSEKWVVGLSVPRLLPSTINNNGTSYDLYNQHFYMFGAYNYIINERLNFKPAALIRAVKGAPVSTDLALNLTINQVHTAGAFTRNFNTFGVLLQTYLADKYRFAYVFELPSNKSIGSAFTTHEISIGLRLAVFNGQNNTLTNF